MMNMQNTDWWNQTNFDEGVRQYEKSFTENVRQFDTNFAEQQRQYNESLAFNKQQHSDQMAYNYAALNKKSSSGGSGGSGGTPKALGEIPSNISAKAKSLKTNGERLEYIASKVDAGYITEEQGDYLMDIYNNPELLPLNERTWTLTDNGGWNVGGGIDGNGKAKDQYDNEMSMDDIYDELKKTIGKDAAKDYVKKLQKNIGITK
jgi:hypothetical protein